MNTSSPIAIVTGGSRGLGRSTVLTREKRSMSQVSLRQNLVIRVQARN